MPRKPRFNIVGIPQHVIQRGNNREACFAEPEHHQPHLQLWKNCSKRYGMATHACCLMINHIHFLAHLIIQTRYHTPRA